MLYPRTTKRFEKDLKRMSRRGKDLNKLKELQVLLVHEIPLPERYKDHKLSGNWTDHRECHIEPDWLLIFSK